MLFTVPMFAAYTLYLLLTAGACMKQSKLSIPFQHYILMGITTLTYSSKKKRTPIDSIYNLKQCNVLQGELTTHPYYSPSAQAEP